MGTPTPPEFSKKISISYAMLFFIVVGVFWTGYFYYSISTLEDDWKHKFDQLSEKVNQTTQIFERRLDKKTDRNSERIDVLFRLNSEGREDRLNLEDRVLVLETEDKFIHNVLYHKKRN